MIAFQSVAAPSSSPPVAHEDVVLSIMRADVRRRIGRVCVGMPSHELSQLVDRIARFNRRWQLREASCAPADGRADVRPTRLRS